MFNVEFTQIVEEQNQRCINEGRFCPGRNTRRNVLSQSKLKKQRFQYWNVQLEMEWQSFS